MYSLITAALTHLMAAAPAAAATLGSRTANLCLYPEPARQICYDADGASPQDLYPDDIKMVAKMLREHQKTMAQGNDTSLFWKMRVADADGCQEWQAQAFDTTWVMAKLVGNNDVAVLFSDIANTIDGGVNATNEEKAASLANCGTAGGQMAVIVNQTDPAYQNSEFLSNGFTTDGIIIKLVGNPDV